MVMCVNGRQMLYRTPGTSLNVVGHVDMLVPMYDARMIVRMKCLNHPDDASFITYVPIDISRS
jgi:hypothetical protein